MSSPVTQITDYVAEIFDNLLSQFQHDPVIAQLVQACSEEVQRLEDLLYDVLTFRLLDNAGGDVLDRIGDIVRSARLGRTDADYRKIIQVTIAAHDCDGGVDQIVWIASELVGADVRYTQEGPANYRLEYESDATLSDELKAEALHLLSIAAPAGVGWRLVAGEATLTGRYDEDTFGAGTYGAVIGGSAYG